MLWTEDKEKVPSKWGCDLPGISGRNLQSTAKTAFFKNAARHLVGSSPWASQGGPRVREALQNSELKEENALRRRAKVKFYSSPFGKSRLS